MTFMPAEKIDAHLDGFSGYARHVINDHDKLIYTLSRIRNVRMPLGCAVEHGEKDEDAAICFLFAFNSAVNGLLFMYDSIFDWSGEELGSPAETE